ncbi:MAG: efflux RND transporter periplasmic adaptor subunit, partial [Rikenellaceae bacterium]
VINREVVEIRSRTNGYVDAVLVKEGSTVKKGTPIMRIDQREYIQRVRSAEATVKSCEAQVANSRLEIEKITPLVEKNIISKFQLETAKTNLAAADASLLQAKSQFADAKIQLSYTNITSPMNGVIGRIEIYAGSLVSAGNLITSVTENSDALAYFAFDEKKVLELSAATENGNFNDIVSHFPSATFIMSDGTIYPHEGKVEIASGLINRNTGSTQLKATFPNPNMTLRSGASGKVRLPMVYKNTILIPQKATYELQDKKMVYEVKADSTLETRILDIIGSNGDNYVVRSGIEEGRTIIRREQSARRHENYSYVIITY